MLKISGMRSRISGMIVLMTSGCLIFFTPRQSAEKSMEISLDAEAEESSDEDAEEPEESRAETDAEVADSFFSSFVVMSSWRFFAVYKSFVVFKRCVATERKVYIELIITRG